MKIVIASLYANPIHSGHIDYLIGASKVGDYLVVIVNNDNQVKVKGSVPFMDEQQRCKIVQNIKGVDLAVIASDQDGTVINSIRTLHNLGKTEYPDCAMIFAKGGDRTLENIPEAKVCEELGIEMVFGVGGEKTESSSSLIKEVVEKLVQPSLN